MENGNPFFFKGLIINIDNRWCKDFFHQQELWHLEKLFSWSKGEKIKTFSYKHALGRKNISNTNRLSFVLLRFGPVRFGSGHLGMCKHHGNHHGPTIIVFQVLNLPRVPWRIGMTTFSYFSDTVGLAAGEVGEGKRSGSLWKERPIMAK